MPSLSVIRDGKIVTTVELVGEAIVVGRDESSDLVLDHPSVSRKHLKLTAIEDGHRVEDLSTANGTFVDGIREWAKDLKSTAMIQVGEVSLLYRPWGIHHHQRLEPRKDRASAIYLEGDDLPQTYGIAPLDLRRLQRELRIQTKPHLELRPKKGADFDDHIFALKDDVTLIGYGPVAVSLGNSKKSEKIVLAEIERNGDAYEIRSRTLFSKVKVNGKRTAKASIRPGNTLEVDGHELKLRAGIAPNR